MSKHSILAAVGAAAISIFAITLAKAGEMPSQRHARAAVTRHVETTWRHSYALMPTERDVSPAYPIVPPNLFETGRPPAQPGQW
jgi:hypothetical protein